VPGTDDDHVMPASGSIHVALFPDTEIPKNAIQDFFVVDRLGNCGEVAQSRAKLDADELGRNTAV